MHFSSAIIIILSQQLQKLQYYSRFNKLKISRTLISQNITKTPFPQKSNISFKTLTWSHRSWTSRTIGWLAPTNANNRIPFIVCVGVNVSTTTAEVLDGSRVGKNGRVFFLHFSRQIFGFRLFFVVVNTAVKKNNFCAQNIPIMVGPPIVSKSKLYMRYIYSPRLLFCSKQ